MSAAHVAEERLSPVAAGRATEDESAHLARCAPCRAEVAALAAALAAGRVAAPSPFLAVRAERELLTRIDDQHREHRRAWRPAAVALAAALSAGGGALAASFALSVTGAPAALEHSAPPRRVTAELGSTEAPRGQVSAPAGSVAGSLSVPPAARAPAPSLLPLPRATRRQPAAPAPISAQEWVARGDGARAAAVLVAQLAAPASPAATAAIEAELHAVLDRFPSAIDAIDGALVEVDTAFTLRLRCERGLLTRRDRSTVEACRAFAQRFPADPAVRTLSYAAGRVAEDELGDWELAEAEYERALLLSPFAGIPSTDALLARARVRARQGERDEARADLRLYLAQEPGARHDPSVAALANELDLIQ